MSQSNHFEASGNLADWPKNLPGKPTHAAVMGIYHPNKGKVCEILWTADFPELEPAMYWAAKKEVQAIRKGKWNVATRVLWQHDITTQQAVDTIFKEMEPQLDRMIRGFRSGASLTNLESQLGDGPMKPVDPKDVHGYYVELERNDGPNGAAG
jgi:hypothetical protein